MDEILKMFGGAENIWNAIQQNATKVGIEATRIMLELFYVLKSPQTSTLDKGLIVAALGYQLLPKDVLPREKYGLLGFLDNGITLAFAYNRVKASVTPEIENQVNSVLMSWFGTTDGNPQLDNTSTDNYTNNNGIFGQAPIFKVPGNQSVPAPKSPTWNAPHTQPLQFDWNDDEDVVID